MLGNTNGGLNTISYHTPREPNSRTKDTILTHIVQYFATIYLFFAEELPAEEELLIIFYVSCRWSYMYVKASTSKHFQSIR